MVSRLREEHLIRYLSIKGFRASVENEAHGTLRQESRVFEVDDEYKLDLPW